MQLHIALYCTLLCTVQPAFQSILGAQPFDSDPSKLLTVDSMPLEAPSDEVLIVHILSCPTSKRLDEILRVYADPAMKVFQSVEEGITIMVSSLFYAGLPFDQCGCQHLDSFPFYSLSDQPSPAELRTVRPNHSPGMAPLFRAILDHYSVSQLTNLDPITTDDLVLIPESDSVLPGKFYTP